MFFDEDYVLDPVIVDFDKPPIFDEEYVMEPVIVDFDKPPVFYEDLFQNEHGRNSIFEDYFYDVTVFHHSTTFSTYLFLKAVKIRGRIFSNLKRMMQERLSKILLKIFYFKNILVINTYYFISIYYIFN